MSQRQLSATSFLLAFFQVAPLSTRAEVPPAPPATFEARRQVLLDQAWNDYQQQAANLPGKNAFFRAEALFELGKIKEGLDLVNRGLDQLAPGNKENRWIYGGNTGFHAWPGLDCYLRYGKYLDEATKERYREIYTGGAFYMRLSTSNHVIMAAVSRYLATGIWGEGAFHVNPFYLGKDPGNRYFNPEAQPRNWSPERGMLFEPNDPTGEQFIRKNIESVISSGPAEYASRPYGAQNVLPLLTIAECAPDPDLRKRAALAYEASIVQLAPAYLRGHLATFAPRSYPDVETQSPWGVAAMLWPYFGGVEPQDVEGQSEWALRAVTATYRLPEILQPAGSNRSEPYVYRSLIAQWALYHFVNKTYALFSRSPKATTKQFSGQSYPCGVMWDEPDPAKGSHLWITNPSADEEGEMKIHTHGVTPYEQELQHRDALLFVFNIPADYRFPYVLGYVPGGARASMTGQNRIFLHYGSVLIAISSTAPIEWDPNGGIRAPAAKPRAGDSEFRVMANQAALAIETALPSEFSGTTPEAQLAAFRDRILRTPAIQIRPGKKPVGLYTDRNGNRLECTFDGTDRINHAAVNYERWPTLESPWTKQPRSGHKLEVTDGKTVRSYDLSSATWKESPGTKFVH